MATHALCRIISKLGIMSRKQAGDAIIAGRVSLNNVIVTDPGIQAALKDSIAIDGKKISKQTKAYVLLNKPRGYVTTRNDPQGRKTVYSLLKEEKWLFPAGRLDYDTSGLLIMTNDSEFAEFLTNPHNGIWKTYVAKIKGSITEQEIEKLKNGIVLDGEETLPAKAKILSATDKTTKVEIMIHEGMNRQIRKMFEAIGKKVITLSRTAIGNLENEKIQPGESRELDMKEVELLKKHRFINKK